MTVAIGEEFLLVAAGSAVGGIVRTAVAAACRKAIAGKFPSGTFSVNVTTFSLFAVQSLELMIQAWPAAAGFAVTTVIASLSAAWAGMQSAPQQR